jgi:DNA invertase Pin-like site-specific DNA recombinase
VSVKEYLCGRKRRAVTARNGTRTAVYLRVSSWLGGRAGRQRRAAGHHGQKPDLQYDGLRSYAARAGLDIVQNYCDVALSGRREGRPKSAARNHEVDCVLVWKFDRFARSTRHLLTALEEFNHLGVRFVSVQDQVDTDSPMGRAMFTIIGAMNLASRLLTCLISSSLMAWPMPG